MIKKALVVIAVVCSVGVGICIGGINVFETGNVVRVEIDGKLFTEYHYKDADRPYFYPVIGPAGDNVTRNWPMKEVENEERDHPHHRSLWFTHGDVNGLDFWTEGKGPKIVHEKFTNLSSGPDVGVICSESKWTTADGKVVCTDSRKHVFYNTQGYKIMDFEVTIKASNGKIVFGDTKDGSMAVRVAPTMALKGKTAKGHIVNSEAIRDNDAWGKRANWCDYNGPVNGKITGIAILDNSDNPRHPTWWHARDYGFMAANPFGIHDFEKKPAKTGDIIVPEGESLTLKYRILFHLGDEKEGQVEQRYQEYTKK